MAEATCVKEMPWMNPTHIITRRARAIESNSSTSTRRNRLVCFMPINPSSPFTRIKWWMEHTNITSGFHMFPPFPNTHPMGAFFPQTYCFPIFCRAFCQGLCFTNSGSLTWLLHGRPESWTTSGLPHQLLSCNRMWMQKFCWRILVTFGAMTLHMWRWNSRNNILGRFPLIRKLVNTIHW